MALNRRHRHMFLSYFRSSKPSSKQVVQNLSYFSRFIAHFIYAYNMAAATLNIDNTWKERHCHPICTLRLILPSWHSFHMQSQRRILAIKWTDFIMNDWVMPTIGLNDVRDRPIIRRRILICLAMGLDSTLSFRVAAAILCAYIVQYM